MGLREEAIAAASAVAEAREDAAREVLASTLTPTNVEAMTVVGTEAHLLVFCDGDVCLAVRDVAASGARISLVADSAGWTYRGEVTSLASLGRLLSAGA